MENHLAVVVGTWDRHCDYWDHFDLVALAAGRSRHLKNWWPRALVNAVPPTLHANAGFLEPSPWGDLSQINIVKHLFTKIHEYWMNEHLIKS